MIVDDDENDDHVGFISDKKVLILIHVLHSSPLCLDPFIFPFIPLVF